MSLVRHIVLFPLRPTVTEEEIDAALALLRAVGKVDGVRQWRVERSEDTRKGQVIVQNGLVERDSFAQFRESAAHQRAGEALSAISETWLIGDYAE